MASSPAAYATQNTTVLTTITAAGISARPANRPSRWRTTAKEVESMGPSDIGLGGTWSGWVAVMPPC